MFHGVLEILERHAYSWALVRREGCTLDLSSISDPFLLEVLGKLRNEDLTLEVKDISQWIGVPCYYAVVFSRYEQDSHLIGGGMGCHLEAGIAVRRAVTEALQSRAVVIAGAREDITEHPRAQGEEFQQNYELFSFWYEPTREKVRLPTLPIPSTLAQATELALEQARALDPELGKCYYYNFPAPEGVWVVRTILEGAELFGIDRGRMGKRLQTYFEGLE